MLQIVEPLKPVRVLARPEKFPPLKSFSSGSKHKPWELIVDEWASILYLGIQARAQKALVLQDARGNLVGICSFMAKRPPAEDNELIAAYCIHMLGIDRRYRGARLADGSRPSDILLDGAIDLIKRVCKHHIPLIWACTATENHPARSLFNRFGFRELVNNSNGAILCIHSCPTVSVSLGHGPTRRLQVAISNPAEQPVRAAARSAQVSTA
ncbi:MAG TPA: GNAT family N-acetyltransferase [Solirubrobacteraceae bacterium]|nr:GNAT family N-acetyltransferase [Solirubrobacteraceae bacterium]